MLYIMKLMEPRQTFCCEARSGRGKRYQIAQEEQKKLCYSVLFAEPPETCAQEGLLAH